MINQTFEDINVKHFLEVEDWFCFLSYYIEMSPLNIRFVSNGYRSYILIRCFLLPYDSLIIEAL